MIRTFDDLTRSDLRPLTFDEQVILTSALMFQDDQWENLVRDFKTSRPYKIIQKRVEVMSDMIVSDRVLVFASMLCDSPGELFIWAFNLHLLWIEAEDTLDIQVISEKFQRGVPDEDAMQEIWDSQKGFNNDMEADNLLDLMIVWKRPELYITQTETKEQNHGNID